MFEDPDALPGLTELPAARGSEIERVPGYRFSAHGVLDFRLLKTPPRMQLE